LSWILSVSVPPKTIAPNLPLPTGKPSTHLSAGCLYQILVDGVSFSGLEQEVANRQVIKPKENKSCFIFLGLSLMKFPKFDRKKYSYFILVFGRVKIIKIVRGLRPNITRTLSDSGIFFTFPQSSEARSLNLDSKGFKGGAVNYLLISP